MSVDRKEVRDRANAGWHTEGDAFELTLAYKPDVLGLLDELEALERQHRDDVARLADDLETTLAERDAAREEARVMRLNVQALLAELRDRAEEGE